MPRRDNHTRLGFMAFVLGWLGYASLISAAPLKFESTPLFLAFQTEANVIMLIDDSISMNWEIITGDFVQDGRYTNIQRDGSSSGSGQVKHRDNNDDGTPDCNFGTPGGQSRYGYMYGVEFPTNGDPSPPTSQNCNTADDEEWRFRNSDFNPIYFNPKQTYTPWVGFDAAGKPFKDMPIDAAKDNPYDPQSLKIDLTKHNSQGNPTQGKPPEVVSYRHDPTQQKPDGFRFYTWADRNSNGLFDDGEETEYRINRITDAQAKTLSGDLEMTVTKFQQNFANWFSYYRKREYVVKKVYGEIIGDRSNVRVGLVTLHNNTLGTEFFSKSTIDPKTNQPIHSNINPKVTSINTPLKSIDFDPKAPNQVNRDLDKGNRGALLDALYSFYALPGTPLIDALKQTGDYLENANPGGKPRALFPNDDAYLTAAKGGACQQSFVILMTDGLETGSAGPQVGNTDDSMGDDGPTDFNGGLFADPYANTLADVAMHYYQRDLRSKLDDMVPKSPSDQAPHQHMVTYTLTFQGFDGCLKREPLANETIAMFRSKADANRCLNPQNLLPTKSFWPNPTRLSGGMNPEFKMDDLRHAAFNGRGLFLQADNAAKLEQRLREALINIVQRASSAAAVAINTGARSSTSRLYQARFDSGTWSGQLLSTKIDPATGAPSQNLQDSIDSGALLDKRLKDNNTSDRVILTYKPSTASGIPFMTLSDLDPAQQSAFNIDSNEKVDNVLGQHRLDYLRGSDADEGVKSPYGFRVRAHRLGDIINSSPFLVTPPAAPDNIDPHFDDPTKPNLYTQFRDDPKNRQRMQMILVGGNDGMLHIFNANAPFDATTGEGDANAGQEVLAYVPNSVLKHLVDLTSPSYKHRYYVDGSPAAGDVFLAKRGWSTVVVGGLGAGGQGYFALDITDPTTFAGPQTAERVLWEFTDADDPDLGLTFSQPSLVRMANGRWASVFGNGYNNTDADGHASTTGHAVFFIVFLDGPSGPGGTWVPDLDYIKIDTGVGDTATPNGLATPAVVDTKGKLTAEYLVAGDLQGNLWRVDVTSQIPTDWQKQEKLSLVFQTREDVTTNTRQPITSRPEVGRHPENFGGFVVFFGTGKYLELVDNSTIGATTQTFYGIWDKPDGTGALVTCSHPNPCVQDNALVQQLVIPTSTPPTVTDNNKQMRQVRVTTNNPVNWKQDPGQGDLGFFLDLPAPGEKQVSDSVLRSGRIFFSTLIPNDKPDQPCAPAGTSFIMALDVNGGTRLARSLFDINKDKRFDDQDQVTINEQRLPFNGLRSAVGIVGVPTLQDDVIFLSGSDSNIEHEQIHPGSPPTGRQAWRKITQ